MFLRRLGSPRHVRDNGMNVEIRALVTLLVPSPKTYKMAFEMLPFIDLLHWESQAMQFLQSFISLLGFNIVTFVKLTSHHLI